MFYCWLELYYNIKFVIKTMLLIIFFFFNLRAQKIGRKMINFTKNLKISLSKRNKPGLLYIFKKVLKMEIR